MIDAVKSFEDPLQMLFSDARAIVLHFNRAESSLQPGPALYPSLFRGILYSIIDQVDQYLFQSFAISVDFLRRRDNFACKPNALLLRLVVHFLHRLLEQLAQRKVPEAHLHISRLDTGDIDEVVQQTVEPCRLSMGTL